MKLLTSGQIRQLVEMAEQTREALSSYVGYAAAYNSTALQLLDEWIERHLRQFPQPSQKMRLLWASFVGEVFRRHNGGEWIIQERGAGGGLAMLCPTEGGGQYAVDVMGQVNRRITQGMAASLAFFYAITSIELKTGQ
ncbi:MAG: hypothetical protein DRI77_02580 [Chloroflexi bacterium]|nr:MAG: hypothetical protein B6I34_03355 [Anaerolineaceae bacterium 4572_32.1]RLC99518.1 MAG: hypothetical protein DRI77_02580 [Chloroflexota bacterium]